MAIYTGVRGATTNNLVTDSGTSGKPKVAQNLEVVKPNSSQYNSSNTFKYTGTSSSGSGRRSGGSGGSGGGAGTVAAGTGDTYWDASSVWSDYLNQMMELQDCSHSTMQAL